MTQPMHVFLLRHGEAADHAPDGSLDDERRELTVAGIARLKEACAVYARLIGEEPHIFHSPLKRAKQTADIMAAATQTKVPMIETRELRPGGRAAALVDLLQSQFLDGRETVALVSHEPIMGDLLGLLSSGSERLSIPMSKGMLAAIRLSEPQMMIGRIVAVLSEQAATRL